MIIIIIFIIIIYYFYNNQKNILLNEKLNNNNTIFNNWETSHLYKNPSIIIIFKKLLPFYKFNEKNYSDALKSCNHLIKIHDSAKIGHKYPNQTIDMAEELQRNIMNNIQSLIHSFPSSIIGNGRFEIYCDILHKITQKVVNDIREIYFQYYNKNKININTPPPSIYSGPSLNPIYSKGYNKYWNFYY